MLDTRIQVATPEGVELGLPLAGVGARSLAWLIDALIKFTALVVFNVLLQFMGELGIGLRLIATFLVLWFYNVAFEVLRRGATPGKKFLGLRVMHSDGTPVGWNGSMIRNLVRFVDVLPGCYAFGCLSVLCTRKFQRLGDLAADTVVIFAEASAGVYRPFDSEPLPVTVPLAPEEAQAIVSFGERSSGLNADRAEELAAILAPVLGEGSAERLRGHASWLAGGGRAE